MKNRALYYPYINVPKSAWISQQLLYLDKLGSIVPSEYIYNPDKLSPYMRDLVSAELVEQIFPAQYIPYDTKFEENFIKLIKSKGYDKMGQKSSSPQGYFKIHIEKFGDGLKDELKSFGLLNEIGYPWCFVEKNTATLLMTYVAAVIGMSEELSMTPITDSSEYLGPYLTEQFPLLSNKNNELIVLNKLIPVPENPIPVLELSNFKEKYSTLLSPFRDEISSKIDQISLITDKSTRDYEIKNFINKSEEKIEEITKRIEEQKWGKVNLGTLSSLTASAIPVMDINEPSDLLKAIPGLIGAVYSVIQPIMKNRKRIKAEPLAYASYVRNGFFR